MKHTILVILMVVAFGNQKQMYGQADFTFRVQPHELGSSDKYGYGVWDTEIGTVQIEDFNIPVRVYFSTDPRLPEGLLGNGWSMPLMESRLVEQGQNELRWHRPDRRIWQFGIKRVGREGNSSADTVTYETTNSRWMAIRQKGTRRYTLKDTETGIELIYNEGCLEKLNFPRGGSYSISYNSARRPLRLTRVSISKVLLEIQYGGGSVADKIIIDRKSISLDLARQELQNFGTNPLLQWIDYGNINENISISYRHTEKNVNRIEFGKGLDPSVKDYLEWNATNGFILRDNNASYVIKNDSLSVNGTSLETSNKNVSRKEEGTDKKNVGPLLTNYNWKPTNAEITRVGPNGRKEYHYYDQNKGTLTQITQDGIKTVTTYLLTPGPMMKKVRKVEKFENGKLVALVRSAYDETGRKVREIDAAGNIAVWDYNQADGAVSKFVNGNLAEILTYNNKMLIAQKTFRNGKVIERIFKRGEKGTIVENFEDGVIKWREEYREGGTLKRREQNQGNYIVEYDDRGRESRIIINGVLQSERQYDVYGLWERILVYDEGSSVPNRTFTRELDKFGKLVSENVTEHQQNDK